MKTSEERAAFKVTGLLYAIVLLLIVNFYFIHTAFESINEEIPLLSTIYILAVSTILFAMYSIYFVRLYIHKQMKKHSMYDHDTSLFNKKFFLAELHTSFERADRTENPLSMLSASFDANALQNVDEKSKKVFMKELGEIFTTVTRGSDIVCRYDVNHIVVLLPLTEDEEARILEGRLEDALAAHDFHVNPEVTFNLTTTQAEWDETEEAFLERAL